MNRPLLAPEKQKGFTLLEMLVVMAILLILIVGSISLFRGMGDSRQLTAAQDMVMVQLSVAQQSALSSGLPVRWQLLEVVDPRNNDEEGFRLTRTERFNAKNRTWETLEPLKLLPGTVRGDQGRSSLLAPALVQVVGDVRYSGQTLSGVRAASVVFMPSGETRLNPVAVHSLTLFTPRATDDFATIQIDPVTGQTRSYRP